MAWFRNDPWNTVGSYERIRALDRAVNALRKARTGEERRSCLTLIRELCDGLERHVASFDRDGWPRRAAGQDAGTITS